jgi:hypothetical protein
MLHVNFTKARLITPLFLSALLTLLTLFTVTHAGAALVRISSYDVLETPVSGFGGFHTFDGTITDTGRTVSGSVISTPDGIGHVLNYTNGSGTLNDGGFSTTHLLFTRPDDLGVPLAPEITLHLDNSATVSEIRLLDTYFTDIVGVTVVVGGNSVRVTPAHISGISYYDLLLDLRGTALEGIQTDRITLRDFSASFFGSPIDQFGIGEIEVVEPGDPLISGTPSVTAAQGMLYSFTPTAPTALAVSGFSIQNKPVWATFDPDTGTLSGSPGAADVGVFGNIIISATDGTRTRSLPPFSITIIEMPTIGGTPAVSVNQGEWYSFTPTATNAGFFSISGKPAWALFDSYSGTLSGTPGSSDSGTFASIVITAHNGPLSTSLAEFAINVTPAPPSIGGTPLTGANVGGLYRFTPYSTFAGSFTVNGLPAWAQFDTTSGTLSGTPGASDVGVTSHVTITAVNGPYSASLSFSITVVDVAVTITTVPDGLSYSVDGIRYTGSHEFRWIPGTLHDLAANSPQPVAPGAWKKFVAWSDGGARSRQVTAPTTSGSYSVTYTDDTPPRMHIASGYYHTLGVMEDGAVYFWGYDANAGVSSIPAPLADAADPSGFLAGVTSVSATMALKRDGTVWAMGNPWAASGSLVSDANDPSGNLTGVTALFTNGVIKGDGSVWTVTAPPTRVGTLTDVVAAAGGTNHNLAVKRDGTVWAWGANWYGQLGTGTYNDSTAPVQISGLTDVVAVAVTDYGSAAVRVDGTVLAWGNIDACKSSTTPVQVLDGRDPTGFLTNTATISGGTNHFIALKQDGTIRAWGDNYSGQLGYGTNWTLCGAFPVRTDPNGDAVFRDATEMAAGGNTSFAVSDSGAVWAWGDNYYGQYGSGYEYYSLPYPVPSLMNLKFYGVPARSVVQGSLYSFTPVAVNATGFSIANKPAWADFSPDTGTLSGTPGGADVGVSDTITITAVINGAAVALQPFSITVIPLPVSMGVKYGPGGIVIGPSEVTYGSDARYYIYPYPGYMVSDVLVDNVSVGAVPYYDFTVVTSGHSISALFASSLQVLKIIQLPDGNRGTPYSQILPATGGVAPYLWRITSGALPRGVTLNAASGVISGTPTATGRYSFIAQVTDAAVPAGVATVQVAITIAAPLPDLVVTAVSGPSSVSRGKAITVSVTVRNQGKGAAAASRAVVALFTDAANAGSVILLGSVSFRQLDDGDRQTQKQVVTIPAWVGKGTYYLGAVADSLAAVYESNEGNNVFVGSRVNVK